MLSKTEGSHLKALCVCFTQCLWENLAAPKNTVLPLSERQTVTVQVFFLFKVFAVISLCLLYPLSQPLCVLSLYIYICTYVHMYICTYTCVYINGMCVYIYNSTCDIYLSVPAVYIYMS